MNRKEATQKIMDARQKQLDDVAKEEMKDIMICLFIFVIMGLCFWGLIEWMIAKGIVLPFSGLPGRR